jgi:Lipocalin-like domain
MKKLNLLLTIFIGLTILSCSSDNDNNNTEQDILIGIWKPVKFVEVFSNAGEVIYEHSSCYQQSRITFSSDNILNQQLFDENNSGDCFEDNSDNFISGTWEKISETQYNIQITFFNEDTQQNEIFEGEQDEIVFLNENTMRIVFNEGVDFNGDFLEYEYDEYIRVE